MRFQESERKPKAVYTRNLKDFCSKQCPQDFKVAIMQEKSDKGRERSKEKCSMYNLTNIIDRMMRSTRNSDHSAEAKRKKTNGVVKARGDSTTTTGD